MRGLDGGGGSAAWTAEAGLPAAGLKGGEALLFVGRRYGLEGRRRKTLLAAVDLLRRGGVSFGVLGAEEPETGRATLEIGALDLFDRLAARAAEAIRRSGARTVICLDPEDLSTFRAHVPKVADLSGIRFVSVAEVLDELVAKGRIKPRKRIDARVAYHDPCRLGRLSEASLDWRGEIKKILGHLVIYDPPRPVNRGTFGCYDPPPPHPPRHSRP